MKPKIKVLAILLAFNIMSVLVTNKVAAWQTDVSFQVFYDQLSPYGQWVNYPNYGYVWMPNAGSDFVPYSTGGYWILTDYGWTWVSNYSWGWAPFHYGRWGFDNSYGWFWVPDNEWGPSWVSWRSANGYYGWEPMEPGVSISVSFGRNYDSRNDHWTFVRDRDIERSDVNHYYVNRTERDKIIRNSTVINKTYVDNSRHTTYISGPARDDVQKATGKKINPVAVKESNKPGQVLSKGQLQIYRPQIKKNNDKNKKPAPAKLANLKDVKRNSQGNVTNQPQKVTPKNNTKKEVKQNTVKTQNNNNNKVQPSQQQNTKPQDNNKKVQQQNKVKPQNNNINKVQPSQQQNNPKNNIKQEQKQNNLKPQDNNNNKIQPSQQLNNKPQNNDNAKEKQQNNVKQQDNNNNRVQPSQQQNNKPQDNNRNEQQQNNVRQDNNRTEQPNNSNPGQDKKRTE